MATNRGLEQHCGPEVSIDNGRLLTQVSLIARGPGGQRPAVSRLPVLPVLCKRLVEVDAGELLLLLLIRYVVLKAEFDWELKQRRFPECTCLFGCRVDQHVNSFLLKLTREVSVVIGGDGEVVLRDDGLETQIEAILGSLLEELKAFTFLALPSQHCSDCDRRSDGSLPDSPACSLMTTTEPCCSTETTGT